MVSNTETKKIISVPCGGATQLTFYTPLMHNHTRNNPLSKIHIFSEPIKLKVPVEDKYCAQDNVDNVHLVKYTFFHAQIKTKVAYVRHTTHNLETNSTIY